MFWESKIMAGQTYLLIGLGNPGREYAATRHNIGFRVIDALLARLGAGKMRLQSQALVASARTGNQKILLAKPQTYMNLSGQAAQGLAHYYKVELGALLVAHDDIDLPFGMLRIRPGGGHGGQKGVASAIEGLGSRDFARLRIGVGRPPGRMQAADYVLQEFSRDEAAELPSILERSADAALCFVQSGIQATMNRYNGTSE